MRWTSRAAEVAPFALAAIVTVGLGVRQIALVDGDLFNSYPFLFSDSYDWIMQGRFFSDLVGGAELPALRILREPGLVLFSTLDQAAGGNGTIILLVLTGANLLAAVYLTRSILLVTSDWRLALFGVFVFLFHPTPAELRFYVMADQLAIGIMTASMFYMLRWLQDANRKDLVVSAALGGLGGLAQIYGMIPFLIGGCFGLAKLRFESNRGRRLFQLALVGVLAMAPTLLFRLVLRHLIPHEQMPVQGSLLRFSLANWRFYLETWTYHFVCLAPLALLILWKLRSWARDRRVLYLFTTAAGFNVLAFFYQWQDARYSAYSFVAVLATVMIAVRSVFDVLGDARGRRALKAAAVVSSAAICAVQFRGSPEAILGPKAIEVVAPQRDAWFTRLFREKPIDRFDLRTHCTASGMAFCDKTPFVERWSSYETYTWRYYNCLRTRRYQTCVKPSVPDRAKAAVIQRQDDSADATSEGRGTVGEILAGSVVVQEFAATRPNLSGISVVLATFARSNSCRLEVRLSEVDSGTEIHRSFVSCNEIADNMPRFFRFGTIADAVGRRFRFTLASGNAKPGNAITAYMTGRSSLGSKLLIGSKEILGGRLAYTAHYEP